MLTNPFEGYQPPTIKDVLIEDLEKQVVSNQFHNFIKIMTQSLRENDAVEDLLINGSPISFNFDVSMLIERGHANSVDDAYDIYLGVARIVLQNEVAQQSEEPVTLGIGVGTEEDEGVATFVIVRDI
jgi:hypothetical protein